MVPLLLQAHLESGAETHPGGRKSAGGSVCQFADTRRKGAMGVGTLDVLQSLASS